MFKTLLELVELFCGCVRSLKETVSLGTTASQSFPVEDLTAHLHPEFGALRFALWFKVECGFLQYVEILAYRFQFAASAVWHCCTRHLPSGLCLPRFICPALPVLPRVSLPCCHRQVVSLHACRTPEVGRMRSECTEMAGSVYQTRRIRYSVPHCLPKLAFSDGFPDV